MYFLIPYKLKELQNRVSLFILVYLVSNFRYEDGHLLNIKDVWCSVLTASCVLYHSVLTVNPRAECHRYMGPLRLRERKHQPQVVHRVMEPEGTQGLYNRRTPILYQYSVYR